MPRCKHCKDKFTAQYFNQKYCMYKNECIKAFSDSVKEKKQKDEDKRWRKIKKEKKEALMTLQDWLNKLEPEINAIARLIDKGSYCMMCQKDMSNDKARAIHGCHFRSVGASPSVRFNLYNIWIGCKSCNKDKGGNVLAYEDTLIEVYGQERMEYIKYTLQREWKYLGLSKDQIKEAIPIAREIRKELETTGMEYSTEMRWKLREKYNERLGIYKQ